MPKAAWHVSGIPNLAGFPNMAAERREARASVCAHPSRPQTALRKKKKKKNMRRVVVRGEGVGEPFSIHFNGVV